MLYTGVVFTSPDNIRSDQPISSYSWSSIGQTNISNKSTIEATESDIYNIENLSNTGYVVMADYYVPMDTLAPTFKLPTDILLDCNTPTYTASIEIGGDISSLDYSGDWLDEVNQIVNFSDAGIYSVTVTGNNGYSSIVSSEIKIDTSELDVRIVSNTHLNCNIDTIEAGFTIPNNYNMVEWNGFNTQSTDSILTITSPGTYTLKVTGENGCITTREHIVTQDLLPPTFMASASEINCASPQSTIYVDVTGPTESIIFYDNNEIELGSGNNFVTDDTDVITIEVTGTNGCTSIAGITAQVDLDNFDFDVISGTLNCNTTEVFIKVEDNLNFTEAIIFDNNGNLIGDLSTPITLPGLYRIDLTLDNGCTSTSEVFVEDDITYIDFTISDIELNCATSSTAIDLIVQSTYEKVEILNQSDTVVGDENIQLSETGIYSVTVYNTNGCPNTKSFNVTRSANAPQLEDFTVEAIDCAESVVLQINNITGGVAPYMITIDNSTLIHIGEVNILTGAEQYDINIVDINGCSLDTTITISELIPITIEPITDITIRVGKTAQLILDVDKVISEISEIQWREEQFLSCYDCLDPIFSGDSTTTYQVTVTDINGCTAETEVRVILQEEIEIDYYIPNVIHLSNSNPTERNFTLFSDADDISLIQNLSIFDRGGNKVFNNFNFLANNPALGWDGTFNDVFVEQGVYVYFAVIETSNGETFNIAGDLTVLR